MIAYQYKCEKCGEIIDEYEEMNVDHPKVIVCPKCKGNAYRYWGNAKIIVPESFQAMSELYNGDNASNFDYISSRMKHGTRPSGKEKVLY